MAEPFTPDDFAVIGELVLDSWIAGVDRDWSVPAGTLEWSCFTTADHTIDCVFSYALFFGSRKLDGYPKFGEIHATPDATPSDLVDGLRAVTTMLWAVTSTAPPDARANIFGGLPDTGDADDFAARGALEMILHGFDIASGLGAPYDPPRAECERLLQQVRDWPWLERYEPTDDPWIDVLTRSGRTPV